jgi:hypothetical protein
VNEAYQTGVRALCGLLLEYSNIPGTLGSATQYEFLSGNSLLCIQRGITMKINHMIFLTLDVYPNEKTNYQIYVADGKTRDHRKGNYATIDIINEKKTNLEVVGICKITGNFNGMLEN